MVYTPKDINRSCAALFTLRSSQTQYTNNTNAHCTFKRIKSATVSRSEINRCQSWQIAVICEE